MLFEPEYSIYYNILSNENIKSDIKYNDIISTFNDPEFPLTLGRSDEMIQVMSKPKTIDLISPPVDQAQYLKNTILPFNYKDSFWRVRKRQNGERLYI